jgi:hypothetical protein
LSFIMITFLRFSHAAPANSAKLRPLHKRLTNSQ